MSKQLYGRESDKQKIGTIVAQDDCRLLTILGMGGIGKTRLLDELVSTLADDFADGVIHIDLQPLENHTLVLPKILEALDVEVSNHADQGLELIARLANKQILLAFDNFEHVLEAAQHINLIIENAPSVKMIVTSREALRLQEEHIYSLSGLSMPPLSALASELLAYSATQLFIDRARQVRHDVKLDLESVAEICRLVDGVPLAIELAAIWAKVLEADEILKEVQHCIDFLETDLRDIPERHRSIRAVFAGSWGQLSQKEQTALAQLSVFKGKFERAAAMTITDATLKTFLDLRDKSLLLVTEEGRYRLHDLVRQLAFEKLEDNPQLFSQTQERHAAYYAEQTAQFADLLCGSEQKAAQQEMSEQIHNIRVGFAWAKAHLEQSLIQKYLLGIALYFQKSSRTHEGLDLLTFDADDFVTLCADLYAHIQLLRGWMLLVVWKNQEGVDAIWAAIQHMEQMPRWLGMALIPAFNQPELFADRYPTLIELIESELKNATDIWQRAWLLKAYGEVYFVDKQYQEAADNFQKSADCFLQVGDVWGVTWAYGNLGRSLIQLNRFREAADIYERSIEISRELEHTNGWVDVIEKQAELALHQQHYKQAKAFIFKGFQVALAHHALVGKVVYLLHGLANICIALEQYEEAATYLNLLRHHPVVKNGWREPETIALEAQLDALCTQHNITLPPQRDDVDLLNFVQNILENQADPTSLMPVVTTDGLVEPLTEREAQILRLIAVGLSNKEIADELIVAVGTVKTHAHNLYSKLGVSNRTEAATKAIELNLI